MKIGEVIEADGGGAYGDATVGKLVEYLKQFPSNTPLIMRAEPDACSERGYPFFSVHPSWATWDEWETATIPDGTDENDLDVKAVVITVDH